MNKITFLSNGKQSKWHTSVVGFSGRVPKQHHITTLCHKQAHREGQHVPLTGKRRETGIHGSNPSSVQGSSQTSISNSFSHKRHRDKASITHWGAAADDVSLPHWKSQVPHKCIQDANNLPIALSGYQEEPMPLSRGAALPQSCPWWICM